MVSADLSSCVFAGRRSICRLGFGIYAAFNQYGTDREPWISKNCSLRAMDWHNLHLYIDHYHCSGVPSDDL